MSKFDHEGRADMKTVFESMVLDWQYVTHESRDGYPSYKAGKELFAVLTNKGVALTRLPPDQREDLENEFRVGPFETGGGTGLNWAHVQLDDVGDLDRLLPYIQQSYQTALNSS